jgi:hypothetical protein
MRRASRRAQELKTFCIALIFAKISAPLTNADEMRLSAMFGFLIFFQS